MNGIDVTAILLVFYLFLLVRPQYVRGPTAFRLGLACIGIVLLARIGTLGWEALASSAVAAGRSPDMESMKKWIWISQVGELAAFVAAVFACYVPAPLSGRTTKAGAGKAKPEPGADEGKDGEEA